MGRPIKGLKFLHSSNNNPLNIRIGNQWLGVKIGCNSLLGNTKKIKFFFVFLSFFTIFAAKILRANEKTIYSMSLVRSPYDRGCTWTNIRPHTSAI